MRVHTFVAASAAQAVEQIRRQLGVQAVVLNVRHLPGEGLARLWQKPRIEVLACVPESPAPTVSPSDALAELRLELAQIKEQVQQRAPSDAQSSDLALPSKPPAQHPLCQDNAAALPAPSGLAGDGGLSQQGSSPRLAKVLESGGLLPVHAQRVLEEVRAASGAEPPGSLVEECRLARAALIRLWRPQRPGASNLHIFIGPPGTGKTTVLCKWLAQAVLVEGRRARVWRLDGPAVNTAESLSVFAEILGVPVERFLPKEPTVDLSEMTFVDLPGVNWNDIAALQDLARQLGTFPAAEIHLVLNAAYDGQLLLAQGRAYSGLPAQSVILTHLDEEPRWGKLWNFLLGGNFTLSHLSAGQNIPGDFHPADPEQILARQFPQK